MVEVEDDPIFELMIILQMLRRKSLQVQWDNRVFGVDTYVFPLYIFLPELLEIIKGTSMLNISLIQVCAM